jgi:hypothetical protein
MDFDVGWRDTEEEERDTEEEERDTEEEEEGWSPWTLTQVSKEFNKQWRPFYYSRTTHSICPLQLEDYMATFFDGRGEHIVPDERRGPPVNLARVSVTAGTVARISLLELQKAEKLFTRFICNVTLDGWGQQKRDKEERDRWISAFRQLNTLFRDGSLRELLPGTTGAGKMEGLFMDRHRNIRLHPTPEYLSSYPALDPGIRNALFELWSSAPVLSIHLLVLPFGSHSHVWNPRDFFKDENCELTHPFWRRFPHRSHISSVCFAHFDGRRSAYSFLVKPFPYVLPEGYSLKGIGINEQEIRETWGAAVYVQLAGPEDDEFNIRLEGPDEFFYDQEDGDFMAPDAETGSIMTNAPEAGQAAHNVDDDDDMEGSDDDDMEGSDDDDMEGSDDDEDEHSESGDCDTVLLAKDMEMPLEQLMKRVYGVTMEP